MQPHSCSCGITHLIDKNPWDMVKQCLFDIFLLSDLHDHINLENSIISNSRRPTYIPETQTVDHHTDTCIMCTFTYLTSFLILILCFHYSWIFIQYVAILLYVGLLLQLVHWFWSFWGLVYSADMGIYWETGKENDNYSMQMWLDFGKPTEISHLAYSILLLQLIATLIHCPCTVTLPGLADWSSFLEQVYRP